MLSLKQKWKKRQAWPPPPYPRQDGKVEKNTGAGSREGAAHAGGLDWDSRLEGKKAGPAPGGVTSIRCRDRISPPLLGKQGGHNLVIYG